MLFVPYGYSSTFWIDCYHGRLLQKTILFSCGKSVSIFLHFFAVAASLPFSYGMKIQNRFYISFAIPLLITFFNKVHSRKRSKVVSSLLLVFLSCVVMIALSSVYYYFEKTPSFIDSLPCVLLVVSWCCMLLYCPFGLFHIPYSLGRYTIKLTDWRIGTF